jgi:hypothetical protein
MPLATRCLSTCRHLSASVPASIYHGKEILAPQSCCEDSSDTSPWHTAGPNLRPPSITPVPDAQMDPATRLLGYAGPWDPGTGQGQGDQGQSLHPGSREKGRLCHGCHTAALGLTESQCEQEEGGGAQRHTCSQTPPHLDKCPASLGWSWLRQGYVR